VARHKEEAMNLHRSAILTVALLALGGCTRVSDLSAPNPTATLPSPQGSPVDSTIYYLVESDSKIFIAPETHQIVVTDLGISQLQEMITGDPQDPDFSSLWPEDTRVLGFSIDYGTAIVDFSAEVLNAGVGGESDVMTIQQAVYTLTELPGVERVEFRVEGKASGDVNGRMVEDWWGHTGLAEQPFTRDEFALAPITIAEPAEGDSVPATVEVRGDAMVFEANVVLRLRGPDGTVATTTHTTASIGAPERGTWSIEVTIPGESGEIWTIEAVEISAEDGSDSFVMTRAVKLA